MISVEKSITSLEYAVSVDMYQKGIIVVNALLVRTSTKGGTINKQIEKS